ncbi:hypothetical protein [Bradyrhizobium tunisiense]|uniref:hypothetical protein n=1 Tax=Bradyrhizobium tunisiense TaxID=3278709 RepID=UPI0035DCF898
MSEPRDEVSTSTLWHFVWDDQVVLTVQPRADAQIRVNGGPWSDLPLTVKSGDHVESRPRPAATPFLTPAQFVQLQRLHDAAGGFLIWLEPPTRQTPIAGVTGLPTNAEQARALRSCLTTLGIALEPWQTEMLDRLTRAPSDSARPTRDAPPPPPPPTTDRIS